MKKIKILKILDEDDSYPESVLDYTQGISEWNEVSDEDYNLIRCNLQSLNKTKYGRLVMLVDEDVPPREIIKDIKAEIQKQQAIRLASEKKHAQKRLEQKRKSELAKIEKAKKILRQQGLLNE